MKKKISILDMVKMKKEGKKLTWITAYDLPFASAAEKAGIDMILVGDSGGMVQLGYQTTNPVTMDEMIVLSKAARSGAPNTFIIGDMPQGSYEISCEDAIRNALRFVKEAGCDAIKLEGGSRMSDRVRAIVNAGILVIGHLGLTPQSTSSFGGYRVQGKSKASFEALYSDAEALCKAGVSAILLEAVPAVVAEYISRKLPIPIYGIGAGGLVDGQLVIMHDLMGFYQAFRPWFAKCYIPQVSEKFSNYIREIPNIRDVGVKERKDGLLVLAQMAIEEYIKEVQNVSFPNDEYNYPITEEQLADVKSSKLWEL